MSTWISHSQNTNVQRVAQISSSSVNRFNSVSTYQSFVFADEKQNLYLPNNNNNNKQIILALEIYTTYVKFKNKKNNINDGRPK